MPLKVKRKDENKRTDHELVDLFRRSGDLEELGVLYERYMALVFGVCLKYFKEREEAKDGVTAIFEKLITEIPRHEIENFKSWLYVLTKNHCLMQIRSRKSEQARSDNYRNEQIGIMESEEELHPMDEEGPDLNRALMDCLEQLKAEQQKCIRLFYIERHSYREVAKRTGLEEKKVKSFIQNGKRNLKICMEEQHGKTG